MSVFNTTNLIKENYVDVVDIPYRSCEESYFLSALEYCKSINEQFNESNRILYRTLLESGDDFTSINEGFSNFLDNVKDEPDGYRLLGWYKDDSFLMPKGNVLVYGEWKKVLGTVDVEIETTEMIYDMADKARELGDHIFLQWLYRDGLLVAEQSEEMSLSRKALAIMKQDDSILAKQDAIMDLYGN